MYLQSVGSSPAFLFKMLFIYLLVVPRGLWDQGFLDWGRTWALDNKSSVLSTGPPENYLLVLFLFFIFMNLFDFGCSG